MNVTRHLTTLATHFLGWEGRISRSEWWLCWLADLGIAWVAYQVVHTVLAGRGEEWLVSAAITMVLMWAATCANVKRCHDRNKPGAWALVAFLPIIGTLWQVVELGMLPGTRGPNTYGPDPVEASMTPAEIRSLTQQITKARSDLLRSFRQHMTESERPGPTTPAPPHSNATTKPAAAPVPKAMRMQEPLIKYGYKRPERTVTRG